MSRDLTCPYCYSANYVEEGEGYGVVDGDVYQATCSDKDCARQFIFETSIVVEHHGREADCLDNPELHKYSPTYCYPVDATKMECSVCFTKRTCTDDEMKQVIKDRGE